MLTTDPGSTAAPQPRDRRVIASWIATIGALCVAVTFTVGAIAINDAPRERDRPSHRAAAGTSELSTVVQRSGRVAEVVTSFGTLTVDQPTFVAGVPARALAGQNHGIQDYVAVDRQLVQVPITLTNGGDSPVRYDASNFSLVTMNAKSGESAPQEPASSTIYPGRLPPSATIDGVLGFVVARNGAPLVLLFHDHRAGTYRVALRGTGSQYRPRPGDRIDHTASATTGQSHSHEQG